MLSLGTCIAGMTPTSRQCRWAYEGKEERGQMWSLMIKAPCVLI
jgi:hypothetical protein